MRLFSLLLTTVVMLPFTLLAGYYVVFIFWDTLQDPPESTDWKSHAYFGGMIFIHVMGVLLYIAAISLLTYAIVWAG